MLALPRCACHLGKLGILIKKIICLRRTIGKIGLGGKKADRALTLQLTKSEKDRGISSAARALILCSELEQHEINLLCSGGGYIESELGHQILEIHVFQGAFFEVHILLRSKSDNSIASFCQFVKYKRIIT
jgi:hypothetical protein